jgi:hypothetical protein
LERRREQKSGSPVLPRPRWLCYKLSACKVSMNQAEPSTEKALRSAQPAEGAGNASLHCPRCFERLEARSCKLICPSCGYYMSCSDYY